MENNLENNLVVTADAFQKFTDAMLALQKSNAVIIQKCDSIQKDNEELKKESAAIKKESAAIKKENAELKKRWAAFTREMQLGEDGEGFSDVIERKIRELRKGLPGVREDVDAADATIKHLIKEKEDLQEENRILKEILKQNGLSHSSNPARLKLGKRRRTNSSCPRPPAATPQPKQSSCTIL